MKTILAAAAPIALMALLAVAGGAPTAQEVGRLRVTASFYPLAYLAQEIGGDRVRVSTLIKPGVEIHTWDPTMRDLVAASDSSLLIYNGADLDPWVQEKILPVVGPVRAVEATAGLTLRISKPGEGDSPEEEGGVDPHTWISPRMALGEATQVYMALLEADPAGTDYYTGRWGILKARLTAIDSGYATALRGKARSVIFVTHATFGYLADAYGFEQRSIVGLHADQQPSTGKVAAIVDEMAASGTRVFYVEPGYSDVYVQVVREELRLRTGGEVRVLRLYHMNGPIDGLDYLGQMEANLVSLREGLG